MMGAGDAAGVDPDEVAAEAEEVQMVATGLLVIETPPAPPHTEALRVVREPLGQFEEGVLNALHWSTGRASDSGETTADINTAVIRRTRWGDVTYTRPTDDDARTFMGRGR